MCVCVCVCVPLCVHVCLFSIIADSTACICCQQKQYSLNTILALCCFTQWCSVSALVSGWQNNLFAEVRILFVCGYLSNVISCPLFAWSGMSAVECSAVQLSVHSLVTGWWTQELVRWKCCHHILVRVPMHGNRSVKDLSFPNVCRIYNENVAGSRA